MKNQLFFKALFIIIGMRLACFDFSMALADEFRYDSHGKRDPFVSLTDLLASRGKQGIGYGELHLEGVIIDPKGRSYAIVNGQIVQEGDKFEGFLLKKIEPNQVTFEKEGEEIEVVLRREEELGDLSVLSGLDEKPKI